MAILVVRCSRKHTVGVAVFPAGSSYRVTTYLVNLMAFDRLLLKGLLTYLLTYVMEFDSCQESVKEKILSEKSGLKLSICVHSLLC